LPANRRGKKTRKGKKEKNGGFIPTALASREKNKSQSLGGGNLG